MAERDDLPLSLFEDVDATDPGHENPATRVAPEGTAPATTQLIRAANLSARARTGWLFRDVTFDCRPGDLVAVAGPAGSGRSALLLALTGRLRPTGGSLLIAGHDACGPSGEADAIRSVTTIARLGSGVGPEPDFTIGMAVDERCLLENADSEEGRAAFADVCEILELTPDLESITAELDPMSRTKLAIALACIAPTSIVALDDIDAGVHDIAEHRLWRFLRRLCDLGITVVASTADLEPAQLFPDVELRLEPGESPSGQVEDT